MIKIYLILVLLILVNILNAQTPTISSVNSNFLTIGMYEKIELDVDLTATYNNAYDFSQVNLQAIFISPSGVKDTVDGFFYQNYNITDQTTGTIEIEGTPEWKIRFSPTEVGLWEYQVFCADQGGTSNIINQNFECTASNNKGYIRTANSMFMKYDDGSQFFGVGENMCWATGQDQNNIIKDFRVWMDTLSAYNGNIIRLWMVQWGFAIEWDDTPLKDYTNRQDNAFYLDWVVNNAEQKDIEIELCFNYHGQLGNKWNENPYNSANGGPCSTYDEFFTNSTAKEYYKNRLRYINARWGYSTAIFSWEQFNEVDMIDYEHGDYHAHDQEIIDWHNEMGQYTRSKDVNNHLISSSCGVDYNLYYMWALPIFDYTQTHYYLDTDEIETLLTDGNQNYQKEFQKPTKNGEFGLFIDAEIGTLPGRDPNAIHIHNALWGSALSGSFSTAMTWWWAPEHYIHNPQVNGFRHFKEIGNFMSSIDLLSTDYESQNFNCIQNSTAFYTIVPIFDWGLAPSNSFTVIGPIGVANTNELGKFIHSESGGNSANYNPPTFNVNYQNSGTFSVYTDIIIGYGAIIEIIIDGSVALHQTAYINSTYSVLVPSGSHTIQVKSVGSDWIKVAKYIFDDAIQLKSNGLVCSNAAYGWVHNKNYNWTNVEVNGEPQAIENAKIVIKDLNNGDYDVNFYNTNTGEIVTTNTYTSENDTLLIEIPSLVWDYSFKITEVIATSNNNILNEINNLSIYPNPVYSTITINGVTKNTEILVFDICGKQVLSEKLTSNTIDLSSLTEGVYIVNITSENKSVNYKIIKK